MNQKNLNSASDQNPDHDGSSGIDLRTCKPGQKLKTRHGTILTYIGPTEPGNYYDHIIQYPPGYNGYANPGKGTRIHSGHVFRKNRLLEDEDVVEILPLYTKYSEGDTIILKNGIFDDFHHIEAGSVGRVMSDEKDRIVMVKFDGPCGLVIVGTGEISRNT